MQINENILAYWDYDRSYAHSSVIVQATDVAKSEASLARVWQQLTWLFLPEPTVKSVLTSTRKSHDLIGVFIFVLNLLVII